MREFRVMQNGYMQMLQDQQLHHWDLVRTLASFNLAPHVKSGKTVKPKNLMPLPFDKQQAALEDLEKRRERGRFIVKKRELLAKKKSKKSESSKLTLLDKVKK